MTKELSDEDFVEQMVSESADGRFLLPSEVLRLAKIAGAKLKENPDTAKWVKIDFSIAARRSVFELQNSGDGRDRFLQTRGWTLKCEEAILLNMGPTVFIPRPAVIGSRFAQPLSDILITSAAR